MTPFDESPAPMPPDLEFRRLVFHVEQVRRKTGIFVRETLNRILTLIVALTVSATLTPSVQSETSLKSTTGSGNYRDWQHFNPQKFTAPERLIPAASVAPQHSASYEKGVPSFPQDPTHANVIYGRGKEELPTAIYAKAFDVLQIGGKLFQAPAAGEVKQVTVDGQGIAIYGTTVYTPLPNTAMVGNPVQVKPFDPSRIFYKDKDLWPAVIYAEPGKEITIANQKVVVPAAGQSVALIFDASGHLKQPAQQCNTSSGSEKAASEKGAAEKGAAEKGAAEKGAAEKAAAEKAAAEKAAAEKAATEKAATEKAAAEKAAAERAVAEKAAAEKAAAEKAAAEKAALEKAAVEKAAAERPAAEKAAAERAAAEKAASEKAAAEKAATEKAAADKAAADKAAAEKAAADKAASDKATADKAAADKAAAESVESLNAGTQKYNLTGEWASQNTTTTNTFKLKIDYSGTFITATVIDQGTGYIPAGQVRFKGDYNSNPFAVTVQRAYPGFTNPYWEAGTLSIYSQDSILVAAKTGNLVLKRTTAQTPQNGSVGSSGESKQTTTKPPTINLESDKTTESKKYKSRPTGVSGHNKPDDDFLKEMQDTYDGLPQEVKDYLEKAGYTIVVGYDELEQGEDTSFGWTNHETKTIHISQNALRGLEPIFIRDLMPDVKEVLLHEVGHAWDFYKEYSKDPGFIEAWRKDHASVNKNEVLNNLLSGDGDKQLNYSNENIRKDSNVPKGAEETAAEIMSSIFGSHAPVADAIKSASKNAFEYVAKREVKQ